MLYLNKTYTASYTARYNPDMLSFNYCSLFSFLLITPLIILFIYCQKKNPSSNTVDRPFIFRLGFRYFVKVSFSMVKVKATPQSGFEIGNAAVSQVCVLMTTVFTCHSPLSFSVVYSIYVLWVLTVEYYNYSLFISREKYSNVNKESG